MRARMPVQSYVWDTLNPNTPDVALTPSSPLCCLRFNPKVGDIRRGPASWQSLTGRRGVLAFAGYPGIRFRSFSTGGGVESGEG